MFFLMQSGGRCLSSALWSRHNRPAHRNRTAQHLSIYFRKAPSPHVISNEAAKEFVGPLDTVVHVYTHTHKWHFKSCISGAVCFFLGEPGWRSSIGKMQAADGPGNFFTAARAVSKSGFHWDGAVPARYDVLLNHDFLISDHVCATVFWWP